MLEITGKLNVKVPINEIEEGCLLKYVHCEKQIFLKKESLFFFLVILLHSYKKIEPRIWFARP